MEEKNKSGIVEVYPFENNVLFKNSINELWIMGDNQKRQTGFGKEFEHLYRPLNTGIVLEPEENVKTFYVYGYAMFILTTSGKLYTSCNKEYIRKYHNDFEGSDNEQESDNDQESESVNDQESDNNQESESESENDQEHGSESDNDQEHVSESESESENEEILELVSSDNAYLPRIPENIMNVVRSVASEIPENITREQQNMILGTIAYAVTYIHNPNQGFTDGQSLYHSIDNQHSTTEINIDNNNFIGNLMRYTTGKHEKENGFELVEKDIEEISLIDTFAFFKKSGKIYVYTKDDEESQHITDSNFHLNLKRVFRKKYPYYEIIFPFDYELICFCKNFVYVKSGNFHHFLSGLFSHLNDERITMQWIYFKSDLKFDIKNAYWSRDDRTPVIIHGGNYYKYSYETRSLELYVKNIQNYYLGYYRIHVCKNDKIYSDKYGINEIIGTNTLNTHIIEIISILSTNIVVVNVDVDENYMHMKNTVYFNAKHMVKYCLNYIGLVYLDKTGSLCLFTPHRAEHEESLDLIKLTDINTIGSIYMYTNVPPNITDVLFSDGLIVIKCNDGYYIRSIFNSDDDEYILPKFEPITLGDSKIVKIDVDMSLIHIPLIECDYHINLQIDIDRGLFKQLLNIVGLIDSEHHFDVKYVKNGKKLSYGDGVKRDFLTNAIKDFGLKYLVKKGTLSKFNDKILSLSDYKLNAIGAALNVVIICNGNYLPIRVPLELIAAFKKLPLSIEELEYFCEKEDPVTLERMMKCKYDNKSIEDYGYDSYEHCLKTLLQYDLGTENDVAMKAAIDKIVNGFFKFYKIKNLSKMNYPTLDYYLSGPYAIDRNDLISKIEFVIDCELSREIIEEFKTNMRDIIKNLTEEQLSSLLKNWSGMPTFCTTLKYVITVRKMSKKVNVHFTTCSVNLSVNKYIINNISQNREFFISALTSEEPVMLDP